MIGIRRPVVVRLVAAITCSGKRGVVVVDMALCARHIDMRSRQRERCGVVIERCLHPRCRVMARLTGRRESNGRVTWTVRPGVVRFVAGVTVRWHGRVVVIDVTLRARNRAVRTR